MAKWLGTGVSGAMVVRVVEERVRENHIQDTACIDLRCPN
jgi:hypothetical protein